MNPLMIDLIIAFSVIIILWRLPEVLSVSLKLEGEMSQKAKDAIAIMNKVAFVIGVTLFGTALVLAAM